MADEENNPGADVNVFILNVASADAADILTTSNAESTVSAEKKIEELHCEETLQLWLEKNSLAIFFDNMKKCGLTSISHLEDITEGDAESDLGMTKFQARRLLRLFNEWKAQRNHEKKGNIQQSTVQAFLHLLRITKLLLFTCRPRFKGL
ncbi:Hypothetical predicted protein [Paramuricea clavata]|uniref:Uncharacterized protein n=1 Tax=Paramuricea clavata TaxID=317549 RepID=A0A6S7H6S0_PARCT|nr:Hypothetical predicted protein [Paramuricea clavata]